MWNGMLDHTPFHRLFHVIDDQMNTIVCVDELEPTAIDVVRPPRAINNDLANGDFY
jgi:hypothetical protein